MLLLFVTPIKCFGQEPPSSDRTTGPQEPALISASQELASASFLPAVQELRIGHFDVGLLLKKLAAELGLTDDQGKQWIEKHVEDLCGSTGLPHPNALSVHFGSGLTTTMNLTDVGKGAMVSQGELIVTGSANDLANVTNSLQTLNELGIRQVLIQTYIFRGEATALSKLPIGWSLVECASTVASDRSQNGVHPAVMRTAAKENSVVPAAASLTKLSRSSEGDTAKNEFLPPSGVTTSTWTVASSIIERSTPVFYTLLTPADSRRVVREANDDKAIERVMSPAVVVFNGHSAQVNATVERPFVTGIEPVRIESDHASELQYTPKIRVYPEGTSMQLRPQLFDGTHVRLNYQLNLCKIKKVETLSIPKADFSGEFTVQMPEVASTKFNTCLDLPIGHALAVSTSDIDDQGRKISTLVICQCSVRNLDGSTPNKK
ncbi:MAG: hypothetical protein KDB22_16735 [Planctomycetales bacterium]|nr:hypothetical protein [Planctomycetales bacterium]